MPPHDVAWRHGANRREENGLFALGLIKSLGFVGAIDACQQNRWQDVLDIVCRDIWPGC